MTSRLSTLTAACIGAALLFALGSFLATANMAAGLQMLIILAGLLLAVVIPPWPLLLLTIVLLPFETLMNVLPFDLPINAFAADIALAAYAVSASARKLSRRQELSTGPPSSLVVAAGIVAVLLLIAGLVSMLNAGGLSLGAVRKLSRFAIIVVAVWATRDTLTLKDAMRAANTFLVVAVIAACYALVQGALTMAGVNTGIWQFVGPFPRLSAGFQDANFFAFYLAIAMPLAVARLLAGRTVQFRAVATVTVLLVASIGTFSRGGVIAMGAGVLAVVLLPLFRRGGGSLPAFAKAGSLLAGLVAALGILAYSAPAGWGAIEQRFSGITQYRTDATGILRLRIWDNAMQLLSTSPVIGIGPGNFLERISSASDTAFYAHNTLLEATVETGIVGGMLLLLLTILVLAASYSSVNRLVLHDVNSGPEGVWILGLTGGLVGGVVGSFFLSNALFLPSLAVVVILLSTTWPVRRLTRVNTGPSGRAAPG